MKDNKVKLDNSSVIDPIKDIITESLEAIIDLQSEEGILKELPIIGMPLKIIKVITGIRDRLFYKKLITFFENLNDISEEEKTTFWRKYEQDEEAKRKLGTQIILYIDRFDDIDKSILLARAFSAYIQNSINYKEFVDLSLLIINLKAHYLKEITYILMRKSNTYAGIYGFIHEQVDLYPLLENDGLLLKSDKVTMEKDRYQSSDDKIPILRSEYEISKLGMHFLKYVVSDVCNQIQEDNMKAHEEYKQRRNDKPGSSYV